MDRGAQPVMTVDEVAEYLRIPRASVYKLAQQGRIPGHKVGKHWRFQRSALEALLASNHQLPAGAGARPEKSP